MAVMELPCLTVNEIMSHRPNVTRLNVIAPFPIGREGTNEYTDVLLGFYLSNIPDYAQINSATLVLTSKETDRSTALPTYDVFMLSTYNPNTVTYNNGPSVFGETLLPLPSP